MSQVRPVVTLIALLASGSAVAGEPAGDLAVLAQRLRDDLLGEARKDETAQAEAVGKTLRSDGTWPDIDYADQTRSNWKAPEHLVRLSTMARAEARTPSPELRTAITAAYDHWVGKDYRNPNWWHNEIGVPERLGETMLFIGHELDAGRRKRGLDILKRAKVGMTGQNLLWKAGIQCTWSCLDGDEPHLAEALAAITKEVRVTTDEGVQPDFSFHQHGRVLYSGGYGAAFAGDSARWAWLVDGTRFAFPAAKREVMLRYLLDGQRWMVRGTTFDYGAIGREISRKGHSGRGLATACGYALRLKDLAGDQRSALTDTIARIRAGAEIGKAPPLEGNRCFWRSDYLVHQRAGWAMTVHMVSKRLENTDMPCNDEGLRNQAIADGATFLYRRGDEYRDIFGVWDWVRIPGTTEVDDTALFKTPVRFTGPTAFVGGVSDGRYGAAVMDYQRDKGRLAAHKAWFLFDDEAVCLGAGLVSGAAKPAITTMNQCLLKGEVQAEVAGRVTTIPQGQRVLEGAHWILHDGIGYVFPKPTTTHLANRSQEGSWWDINHAAPKAAERREVFSLWLEHGAAVRDGGYAYVLVPGTDAAGLQAYGQQPGVGILANTSDLQGVWHHRLAMIQAAFWKPGRIQADEHLAITVDRSCLVLAQHGAKGLRLAVADPELRPLQVRITVPDRYKGPNCIWDAERKTTRVDMTLPGGDQAGSSVVMDLTRE